VKNSKDVHSSPLEKGFATSKCNASEHGKGISIIKEIVEKYHGTITWKDLGDYFVTTIEFRGEREHV
jgi:sensor histidine kinase regulating citrate/malate metabolism